MDDDDICDEGAQREERKKGTIFRRRRLPFAIKTTCGVSLLSPP